MPEDTYPTQTPGYSARIPLRLERSLIIQAAGLGLAIPLGYILATRSVVFSAAIIVALFAGYWIIDRPGNGYLLAVAILLSVPYFWPRVWLLAPLICGAGVVAGVAKTRIRGVDFAVAGFAAWLTLSWLIHPELAIPNRVFLQGILPFQFYLWTRLATSPQLLPRLRVVLLVAAGGAALSVMYETVRGQVLFADAQRYQWGGSAAEVFRGGGIFGGSPPAGVVLTLVFLVLLGFAWPRRRWLVRAVLTLLVAAIILTYARVALLALGGGIAMLAVLLPYRRWGPVLFVGAALALAGAYVWTARDTRNILETSKVINSGFVRSTNNTARRNFFALALPLTADTTRHLIAGRGFNAFTSPGEHDANMLARTTLISRGGPHNDYIRAVLEQGLVGLGLMLCWLVGALMLGIRRCLSLPPGGDRRRLVAALTAAIFGYIVACFVHDFTHNIPSLSVAALLTGLLVSVSQFTADEPTRV